MTSAFARSTENIFARLSLQIRGSLVWLFVVARSQGQPGGQSSELNVCLMDLFILLLCNLESVYIKPTLLLALLAGPELVGDFAASCGSLAVSSSPSLQEQREQW